MIKRLLRSFRHRNYRLYFVGMGISLLGSWISSVAMSWLTYRLTNSELFLGVVAFAGQIPLFFLAPLSGVVVDRVDKRLALVVVQGMSMLLALISAGLAWGGLLDIWEIIALCAIRGVVNSLDMPTRHALVVELVGAKGELPNMIALNSAMFNASRLIGPAVGGMLLAASHEWVCFMADAVSYLPAIVMLCLLRLPKMEKQRLRPPFFTDFLSGVRYVVSHPFVMRLLVFVAFGTLLGSSYSALLPVFAKKVYGGGPVLLGFLMASSGFGALLGAVYLAGRAGAAGIGRVIARASLLFGLGMVGLSFSPWVWSAAFLLFCMGAAMIAFATASNTVLQILIEDAMRGRVMSLYAVCFVGMMPFGSLLGGALAHHFGVHATVALCGLGCLGVAAYFRPLLGRIDQNPLISGKG